MLSGTIKVLFAMQSNEIVEMFKVVATSFGAFLDTIEQAFFIRFCQSSRDIRIFHITFAQLLANTASFNTLKGYIYSPNGASCISTFFLPRLIE